MGEEWESEERVKYSHLYSHTSKVRLCSVSSISHVFIPCLPILALLLASCAVSDDMESDLDVPAVDAP